jgi:hypothetical protein
MPARSGAAEAGLCQDEERPSHSLPQPAWTQPRAASTRSACAPPLHCARKKTPWLRPFPAQIGPSQAHAAASTMQRLRRNIDASTLAPLARLPRRHAISTTGLPPVVGAMARLHGCHGRAKRLYIPPPPSPVSTGFTDDALGGDERRGGDTSILHHYFVS